MGKLFRRNNIADLDLFQEALYRELSILKKWFVKDFFSNEEERIGTELEFHLVDNQGNPANCNKTVLKNATCQQMVLEAGGSMLEINSQDYILKEDGITQLAKDLATSWQQCTFDAQKQHLNAVAIGLLIPLVDATTLKMTNEPRYQELENHYRANTSDLPFRLHIKGVDQLHYQGVRQLIIGICCAFQIHLQIKLKNAVRFYNAAQILAGPLVACSANSPFYLGKRLWHETRIPLFEQGLLHLDKQHQKILARANLGTHYLHNSFFELFTENNLYPIFLSKIFHSQPELLMHLRLHNGTIYRWNRPVIGFDLKGNPHLRIEFRAMPSGPTLIDMMANTTLLLGAIYALALQDEPPENKIQFHHVLHNYYAAAKDGLNAELYWYENGTYQADELLLYIILPLARKGLTLLGLDSKETLDYLEVIKARISNKQTASEWISQFYLQNHCSLKEVMLAYMTHQQQGYPVHEWSLR